MRGGERNRGANGNTLDILDESTTGLHADDGCKLLVRHALVEQGI